MNMRRRRWAGLLFAALCALSCAQRAAADVSLGGFIPFVGIGLTNQRDTFDNDPTGTFFIADPSFSWGGSPLGPGSSAYFDLALLDTGAATHILTQAAASSAGFSIQAEGFRGTNFQTIFGASGAISLRINDPLGVYAAGLGNRTGAGLALTMNTAAMRGQTSFAMLEAPAEWTLPNIIGLPMAAHHAIAIRNDQPQLFQHLGRTVRTPQIELINLGTGGQQGITRRTNLRLRPSAGFIQGPLYVSNFDIFGGQPHDNPLSPSVVENGAMFLEIDAAHGTRSFQDKEFLFDTGADLTVLSQLTAARLGFDVVLHQPDFVLEVEGAGGVSTGVPGFYLDELHIDAVGGSLTFHNVPVAVLDLPNPNDPANTLDGIIGMHLFNGRNLVIDANPAASPNGSVPSLYISDPVTEMHTWATTASQGNFSTPANWTAPGTPNIMWDAQVRNTSGAEQFASVNVETTINRLTVAGGPGGSPMTVLLSAPLTIFGETLIEEGGQLVLQQQPDPGGRLDAQFVNIDGGILAGEGPIFVGTGPINGAVRNISGRVAPTASGPGVFPVGQLQIIGDFANLRDGTLAIDLSGTVPTQYDRLDVSRFAFLAGTLEVSLAGFTPSVGNTFTIITTGQGIVGQFDNLELPSGFQWSVAYGANDVVLSVVGLGLTGDYNADGKVDAADYVVWRKSMGATGSGLPADGNGDQVVNQDDYIVWRSNFGRSSAAGAAIASASVPEPNGVGLMLLGVVAGVCGAVLSRKRRGLLRAFGAQRR